MAFERDVPDPRPDRPTSPGDLHIVTEPRVYLVGRQVVDQSVVEQFLADEGAAWQTDTEVGAERLAEMAGRLCYMSFGKGRKSNAEYLGHIIEVGHGSVLEHGVWNFIFTGVSRSFTHELVRHRAGFGYSQLSQRYVDESESDFVEPDCIAADPELHAVWIEAIRSAQAIYCRLSDALFEKFAAVPDKTLRRKAARQAARSVLPNATETKIFVTANARAIRHFIELRCNEHAETEIRVVAAKVLRIMQQEAPALFADYAFVDLPDGTQEARTDHRKV
ncbi:MAG: FAD-dependent thymidylate synthase [Phycisphaerae bacterium]|nr:FAD-dependent thymidylate synthase [Phycisphaerae bacterium]